MAKRENKAAEAAKRLEPVGDVTTGQENKTDPEVSNNIPDTEETKGKAEDITTARQKEDTLNTEQQVYQEELSALQGAVDEEQKKREQAEIENEELKKQLKKEKEEKEAALNQVEKLKTLVSEEQPSEPEEVQPLIWKDNSGSEFTFTKSAPERFNFNGKNKSQEDWMKDDQVMEALVNGNSTYVKQIK